jgi:protein gp37
MSDLFHEAIPVNFIDQALAVMESASHHVYQVLTKRPEHALGLLMAGTIRPLPDNVWIGVSIENSRFNWRADFLRKIPAQVRFISAEPLLGSLFQGGRSCSGLSLEGIDWLIVGGESGLRARTMDPCWARELRDACLAAHVPFFFKQWGGRTSKAGGRTLDGAVYDDMPSAPLSTGRTS